MARLTLVVPVALLITLVLLFKAFDSLPRRADPAQRALRPWWAACLLQLAGFPLSVAAAVGFIALIGQAS
jgi:cobalt-zinc-cadmium resistance protein CzcA